MENISVFTFVILALAVWRLANLLANESGPANMFGRLRGLCEKLGTYSGSLHDGMCCEWCNSVWFGTIITVLYFFFPKITTWVCVPLALSTCAILIKFIRERLEK
jgi:hypothetical protein